MYMRVFEWIIHSVNHEKKVVPTPAGPMAVEAGQRVTSLRQIAEGVAYFEYGIERIPNTKTIRVILDWLKSNGMITVESNEKGTVVSVIKWNTYNCETGKKVTQSKQDKVTEILQCSDTNNNDNKENLSSSVDEAFYETKRKRKLTGKRLETFSQFWDAFDYKAGKAEAADAWLDIPELTKSLVDIIIYKAKAEAAVRKDIIAAGKTPKMAQGWISGKRWENEVPSQPTKADVCTTPPWY